LDNCNNGNEIIEIYKKEGRKGC